jgi:hypothetical protein
LKAFYAIIFIGISLLREDPSLSTGILDMFFLKISDHLSLKLRECIYLTAFVLWPSYNDHLLGVHFFRGHFPSKIGHIAPFLATIQRLSKARVFLLRGKKSEGCFVSDVHPAISHPYLIIETNSWKIRGVSWEPTPARVKASGRGAKC